MGIEKSNNESVFTENLRIDAGCIVCAAGFSSRMDCWKVELLTREGISFLDNSLKTASLCRTVVLVGGYKYEELLKKTPSAFNGHLIENKKYAEGMLSTVQAALEALHGYFFIMPIDMPLLSEEHFRILYEKRDPGKVVRPAYQGIPGHPVLCPPIWRDKLLNGRGRSPSSLIQAEDQRLIPWEDDSVIFDVDTRDAYEAYFDRQL